MTVVTVSAGLSQARVALGVIPEEISTPDVAVEHPVTLVADLSTDGVSLSVALTGPRSQASAHGCDRRSCEDQA